MAVVDGFAVKDTEADHTDSKYYRPPGVDYTLGMHVCIRDDPNGEWLPGVVTSLDPRGMRINPHEHTSVRASTLELTGFPLNGTWKQMKPAEAWWLRHHTHTNDSVSVPESIRQPWVCGLTIPFEIFLPRGLGFAKTPSPLPSGSGLRFGLQRSIRRSIQAGLDRIQAMYDASSTESDDEIADDAWHTSEREYMESDYNSSTVPLYYSSDSDDIRLSDTEEEEEVSEQVDGVKEIMDEALEAEQH
jgi:hypothetical protein